MSSPWTRWDGDWLIDVHRRRVDRELSDALLPALLDPDARVWPADVWPPLVLDDGLRVGSAGGHGPIRYHVIESEPQRVRFAFDKLDGWHEFRVEGDTVVHEIRVRKPSAQVRYVVIHLHDALLEHLLDDIEFANAWELARRWPRGTRWRYRLTATSRALGDSRPVVRGLVAGTVAGIGALHVAWATGRTFPADTRAGLAQAVIGSPELPPAAPTAAVGAALLGMAGAVVLHADSMTVGGVTGSSGHALDNALRAAELVFGARGVIGLIARTGARHRRYRVLNTAVYSPLCLLLAGGIHVLVDGGGTGRAR